MMNLNTTYVPAVAQDLSTPLNISTTSINRVLTDLVNTIKRFIDDAAAGTPGAFYPDVRAAYAKWIGLGGSIGEATVWKFPDKYPGDATARGATARAQLDSLMQEHAYLLSMTTDGGSSGATAEAAAATSSLQANAQDLSHTIASIFGSKSGTHAAQLWSYEDTSFVAYASAGTDPTKSAALNPLNQTASPPFTGFLNWLLVT